VKDKVGGGQKQTVAHIKGKKTEMPAEREI